MAQHIPIHLFEQKKFREIASSIHKAFSKGNMRTSMRYIYEQSGFNKEHDFDEVYYVDKTIPNGIVYNSNRACFEIHYNKMLKEVEQIYLVA